MENEHNWWKWSYKRGKIISKGLYTGWDFRIWPKKILGRFAGKKRSYAGFHRTLGKKKTELIWYKTLTVSLVSTFVTTLMSGQRIKYYMCSGWFGGSFGFRLRKTAHFDRSGVINSDLLSATESVKDKP